MDINFLVQGISPAFSKNTVGQSSQTPAKQPFANFLGQKIGEVNSLQIESENAVQKVATGSTEDLHQAMIAMTKADLSLRLTLEVRNKALEAYQEIMRTPI